MSLAKAIEAMWNTQWCS